MLQTQTQRTQDVKRNPEQMLILALFSTSIDDYNNFYGDNKCTETILTRIQHTIWIFDKTMNSYHHGDCTNHASTCILCLNLEHVDDVDKLISDCTEFWSNDNLSKSDINRRIISKLLSLCPKSIDELINLMYSDDISRFCKIDQTVNFDVVDEFIKTTQNFINMDIETRRAWFIEHGHSLWGEV